jgi:hypothetical protein
LAKGMRIEGGGEREEEEKEEEEGCESDARCLDISGRWSEIPRLGLVKWEEGKRGRMHDDYSTHAMQKFENEGKGGIMEHHLHILCFL